MFFWNSSSQNTINELLKKEDLQLVDVLSDSTLANAIRSPSEAFTTYVTRSEVISELVEWALTERYLSDAKGARYSRAALKVLTNSQNALQAKFAASEALISGLKRFTAEGAKNGFVFGHFQRIIETYARADQSFLRRDLGLLQYLQRNMRYMAVSELLFFIITETSIRSEFTSDMWAGMLEQQSDEEKTLTVSLLVQIVRKEGDYADVLRNAEFAGKLMEFAMGSESNMLRAVTFELIGMVFRNEDAKIDAIQKYADGYKYENNCCLSGAIKVFQRITGELVDLIFTFPISSLVLEAFVNVFTEKSADEKNAIIKEYGLLEKLKENALKHKSEGWLIQLCVEISPDRYDVTEEWKQFYNSDELKTKWDSINADYNNKHGNDTEFSDGNCSDFESSNSNSLDASDSEDSCSDGIEDYCNMESNGDFQGDGSTICNHSLPKAFSSDDDI